MLDFHQDHSGMELTSSFAAKRVRANSSDQMNQRDALTCDFRGYMLTDIQNGRHMPYTHAEWLHAGLMNQLWVFMMMG